MSLKQLVEHFANTELLPIPVDEIRGWIIAREFQDEINFVPVDINRRKLKGHLIQYTYRDGVYGNPRRASNIYYANSLNVCWQRFVCCKEMLHILEGDVVATSDPAKLDKLVLELCSPADPKEMSPAAKADKYGYLFALAALCPLAAVKQIRPAYSAGKKTAYDVALFFRIPEIYIPFVMSDSFDKIYDVINL